MGMYYPGIALVIDIPCTAGTGRDLLSGMDPGIPCTGDIHIHLPGYQVKGIQIAGAAEAHITYVG